jgi:hypothetical protein
MPKENFDSYWEMTFVLSVMSNGVRMNCPSSSKCSIKYSKNYTPIIYHLNPRVVYRDSLVDIWFDPKNVMSKISNLDDDELPFINAKIGNALLDFEDRVSHETTIEDNRRQKVRGRVTDQPVNLTSSFSMMWETGLAGF